jgi:hypothetical protein
VSSGTQEVSMKEIIRDPVWQFIGVASAVLISLVLYYIQRQKKKLSYEIITHTRLLSIKEEFKSNIRILYDGKPVTDVHLLEVNLINSGNTPILKNDYETKLNINCGDKSTILTADAIFVDPPDINPSFAVDGNNIVLEPILLNGGDSIILKIIATQVSRISLGGRIAGVKKFDKYEAKVRNVVILIAALCILLLASLNTRYKYLELGWAEIFVWLLAVGLTFYADLRDNIRKSNYRKRMKEFKERKDT